MTLRVSSVACLATVEAMLRRPPSLERESPQSLITEKSDVSLHIIATGLESDFYSTLFELLGKLQASSSRLNAVKIDFLQPSFPDNDAIRGACRLCQLLLQDDVSYDVSLCIPLSPSVGSIDAWGEFFQSLCRVGRGCSKHSSPDDEDLTNDDAENCNKLDVLFDRGADGHLVGMFWSALAYSSGYDCLTLTDYQERNQAREVLQTCY